MKTGESNKPKRLTKTQTRLYWGLLTQDYRLKKWRGGKWSVEFLLDGFPAGGGVGVNPRTVQALIAAGWLNDKGRPFDQKEASHA